MYKKLILFLLCANKILGGPSFEENNFAKSKEKILEITKLPAGQDISTIQARLRVAGARTKQVNLVLDIKIKSESLENIKYSTQFKEILNRDFDLTGFIKIHKKKPEDNLKLLGAQGYEGLAHISLGVLGENLELLLENINLKSGKSSKNNFVLPVTQIRELSHKVAQNIFENYVGKENIFTSKVAAVKKAGETRQIVLMDWDGGNQKIISSGNWQKSKPHFGPLGKKILYGVTTNHGDKIVEQKIGESKTKFVLQKKDLTMDPVISSGSNLLYVTHAQGQSTHIFQVSPWRQITIGMSDNLSPTLSTNSAEMAFVSNRSGSPQIYIKNLAKKFLHAAPKRLTFKGRYNQTPAFGPQGEYVVFTGRDKNKVFDIFLIKKSSGAVLRVTQNQGRNQEPYFSSSGRFIYFVSERQGSPLMNIFISTKSGDHQRQITQGGVYLSPTVTWN